MDGVVAVGDLARIVAERVSMEAASGHADVEELVTRALGEVLSPADDRNPRYLVLRVDPGAPLVERAYRDLAERLPELMRHRRSMLEQRQIEALLDALAPEVPDDAQKALVMDNLQARQRFLAEVPCLTSKEVAALAGHTAKNLSMTATRWKQAGKVISVKGARGEELFPAFQFRDGAPHPTVARVLAALPKRKSPWQVAFWFVSHNGWLDGATPAERLDDAAAVVAAAEREAEDIVG